MSARYQKFAGNESYSLRHAIPALVPATLPRSWSQASPPDVEGGILPPGRKAWTFLRLVACSVNLDDLFRTVSLAFNGLLFLR